VMIQPVLTCDRSYAGETRGQILAWKLVARSKEFGVGAAQFLGESCLQNEPNNEVDTRHWAQPRLIPASRIVASPSYDPMLEHCTIRMLQATPIGPDPLAILQ
jgi:hypothetical protein